ncbi:MAG: 30S ribosomal protein S20 [Calditrichaeota bacterium]|nr:30S ribosomal protein S20 [Calditrichota bacterium]
MPQHKSNEKRMRQTKKANEQNRFYRATLRTESKKLRTMTEKKAATEQLKTVFSLLDKYSSKGLIHKNKAANQKSKFTKFVESLS